MTEQNTEGQFPPADHADAHFKAYINVFLALCVFTAVSFVANYFLGQNHTSAAIIMVVAVIKAFLVGFIFMHLRSDWYRVYFIIIPVTVMGIMMIIVLLPDIVIAWHSNYLE